MEDSVPDDSVKKPEEFAPKTDPIIEKLTEENGDTQKNEGIEANECPGPLDDADPDDNNVLTALAADSDDSDDETFGTMKKQRTKNVKVRIESDSDLDEETEDQKEPDDDKRPNSPEITKKTNKISNLIDSESEEDESDRQIPVENDVEPEEEAEKGKKEKSKKSGKSLSKRAAKNEAMNKIYSETQRLIRESSVSLPYHRPKQRTLEEFLNRKKIAPELPKASTMAAKVKISARIVSKALEEKEKEAETFYVELCDAETDKTTAIPKISVPEETCIEETQKLQKIDIQQRQNMIHNGSLDFAVSRKLFQEETPMEIVDEASEKSPAEEISQENEKKVQKEFKRDLKDVSIPRKLLDNFEEESKTSEVELQTIPVGDQHPEAVETSKTPKLPEEMENSEDCISETPMISNKELRANQRLIPSDHQDDDDAEEINSGIIGLPPPETPSELKITDSSCLDKPVTLNSTNIKKSVLLNVKNSKPKIRGNPGMMIDLTESSRPNKSAINNLMDRFLMKHATISKSEEKSAEITVLHTEMTADGFKISKDTLSYKLKPEVIDDNELNKPGAKLKRLREELQKQMATKRHEEWKQREKEMLDEEEEEDDEEELEPDENDSYEESEGESEPEVDDIVIKEKKLKNHDFCDDEAEVSDEEMLELSEDEEEGEDDGDDEEEDDDENETGKTKKFTRILPVNEDSNSGDRIITSEAMKETFPRKNTDVDMFSDEEDVGTSVGTINSPGKSRIPEKSENSKSKLFDDDVSPVNDDELLELCSGKFPDSQNQTQKPHLGELVNSQFSEEVTESQLMNLCSGTFPTQPNLRKDDVEKEETPQELVNPAEETENWNLRIVSSSDEENETEEHENRRKKKKIKKLVLSDDEDNGDLDEYSEEESEIEMMSEEEKFIDYDSEENEVIVVPKKDIKKVAANFLEEEAELSGSELGSDDEDEKDLDTYELEEGDNEEIDESKMRDQIGRIHARQVLDEDNRDVRMLKELLFDDGDLHDDGSGRERKFRWKNIDKVDLDAGGPNNDDDDGVEEENYDPVKELEWRKLRLEKQKFLEEKKRTEASEICSDLGDGEIFKLGLKILKKNSANATGQLEENGMGRKRSIVPRSVSELVQCSSNRLNSVIKRGSFLARGDQALAKLAVMIKQTETLPLASKNAGNFIFTHLSPSVEGITRTDDDEDEKTQKEASVNERNSSRKRKSTPMTPRTSKKPRIQVQKNGIQFN